MPHMDVTGRVETRLSAEESSKVLESTRVTAEFLISLRYDDHERHIDKTFENLVMTVIDNLFEDGALPQRTILDWTKALLQKAHEAKMRLETLAPFVDYVEKDISSYE